MYSPHPQSLKYGDMRYNVVEGLIYYYTNESISFTTGTRYIQPVQEVTSEYDFVTSSENPNNWTEISDEDIADIQSKRSPTIPSVAGTATIVLSPHTIPNWNTFVDAKPGMNINTDALTRQQKGILDIEGNICPNNMGTYRVDKIGIQVVPLATDVDYSTLLEKNDQGENAIIFKSLEKELKKGIKKQIQMQNPNQKKFSQVKTASQLENRNPNTDVKSAVVYGSTITFSSTSGVPDPDNSSVPYPISAFPWYYDGAYSEIISYIENPNIIWNMRYTDFIGGGRMNMRTNVDSISFTIENPKPFLVARTINTAEEYKGPSTNEWVNVLDENVSYGAIGFAVPKAFRNVVATRPYVPAVVGTGSPEAPEIPARLGLSPKNIGFCYITWSFTFRSK